MTKYVIVNAIKYNNLYEIQILDYIGGIEIKLFGKKFKLGKFIIHSCKNNKYLIHLVNHQKYFNRKVLQRRFRRINK